MKALLTALLAFLLVPLAARAEGWPTSTPEAQGMSSQELTGLVNFGIDNGFDSLLVMRHGTIVAEAYYAPFAPRLRHRINSATKAVIGSLIGIALKEGLIKSLDQPVLDFLPGRVSAKPDERLKAVTLRHLLDMTSGLDWDEPLTNTIPAALFEMERSRDWVQYVLDRGMARDPGAAFDYNSGGPHLLSAVLSKVTGKSAEDYAKEKLFGPLGITDFLWRRDPQGVSTGGYGLYMLPGDMAKLGLFWLHDGVWQGKRLLPAGWTDAARQGRVDMPFPGLRYANLFWSIPGEDAFMAVGFDRQLIVVLPKLDVVAAFTGARRYSNADGKPSAPEYRLSAVIDRLKGATKSDAALPEDATSVDALAKRIRYVLEEARVDAADAAPPIARGSLGQDLSPATQPAARELDLLHASKTMPQATPTTSAASAMAARSDSMASTASAAAGSTARAPPRAIGSTTGPSSSRCKRSATTTLRSCPSSSTARRSAAAWKPSAASRSSFRARRRNNRSAYVEDAGDDLLVADLDPHDLRRLVRPSFGHAFLAVAVAHLQRLVDHVVLLGAEEQVIGIDAGTHVAAVTDVEAFRDRAVPRHPGGAMGELRHALPEQMAVAAAIAARRP